MDEKFDVIVVGAGFGEYKTVKKSNRFPGVEWIEGTGDFIKIDANKCSGCANCVKICLGSCFKIVHKKAIIDSLENCMECASCWYVCPNGAIDFAWPKVEPAIEAIGDKP